MAIVEVVNITESGWQMRCVLDTSNKVLRLQIIPPSGPPSALTLGPDSALILINTLQTSLPHLTLASLNKTKNSLPAGYSLAITQTEIEFWKATQQERRERLDNRSRLAILLQSMMQVLSNDDAADLLAVCRQKILPSQAHYRILKTQLKLADSELNNTIDNAQTENITTGENHDINHYGTIHRAPVVDLSCFITGDDTHEK